MNGRKAKALRKSVYKGDDSRGGTERMLAKKLPNGKEQFVSALCDNLRRKYKALKRAYKRLNWRQKRKIK